MDKVIRFLIACGFCIGIAVIIYILLRMGGII